MANVVAGAGFTPHIGLRFGVAVGHGRLRRREEVRDQSRGDRHATLMQVEGEWAFRLHAHRRRIPVDATRAGACRFARRRRLDRSHADADAARVSRGRATTISGRMDQRRRTTRDRTRPIAASKPRLGFRVTPDVTLRASYMTRKGYVVGFWDDQFLASIVFAKKLNDSINVRVETYRSCEISTPSSR